MSRATQQLPLSLSVVDSVTVQEERDRDVAYACETSSQLNALSEENAALHATVARLKKDVAGKKKYIQKKRKEYLELLAIRLADPQHPLCQENVELRRTVDDLRRRLREKYEEMWTRPPGPARPSTADLTQLLVLAHPDKWSQGQLAVQLAHELTVVINRLRQGKGVG